MIVVLSFVTFFITIYVYKYSELKLLSPTLWGTGFFMFFSTIWMCTYKQMGKDLSLKALFIILITLIVTFVSENFTIKCIKNKKVKKNLTYEEQKYKIDVNKTRVIVITIVGLGASVAELFNIQKAIGLSIDSPSNFLYWIKVYRTFLINGSSDIRINGFILSQIINITHLYCYICFFIFLYNSLNHRIQQYFLLLPVLPVVILEVLSTNRSGFIFVLLAFIVSFFCVLYKKKKLLSFNMFCKLILIFIIFLCLFFIYGSARGAGSLSNMSRIIGYLQCYTCGGMFAFDEFLIKPWDKNPYFGFYTMQNIYEFFKISHEYTPGRLPFIAIGKEGFMCNVYTSLVLPIQDFGYFGMLLLRAIETCIATVIIEKFVNSSVRTVKFYILQFFSIGMILCFMYFPVFYIFPTYLYNPKNIIRYIVLGWIAIKTLSPQYKIICQN